MFRHRNSPTIVIGPACILGLLGFTMAATPAQSQIPPPTFNPPKSYYLALGDSITYGYQALKAQAILPPSAFNPGYVDVFGARLREIQPGITTINYGCPGESTESFVTGPCIWTQVGRQLHDTFSGSQLQAAVAFLRAHPGEVCPITLTLWGNDFPKLLGPCTLNGQIDLTCVRDAAPGFTSELVKRISSILDQLRSAAPNAEIIVTGASRFVPQRTGIRRPTVPSS
jgi:lysophospholipase L1-like esterase